jgi:endonuclease-3
LENDIRTTGFYHNKAKNIQGCCQGIIERFGGEIPQSIEELTSLPGIGRKTANVVLGNAFGIPGMVVDTHVKRISRRLGLTQNISPEKIEKDLCALIPAEQWTQTAHLFIFHGRRTCAARKPGCGRCVVVDLCEWNEKSKYLNATNG